MISTHAVSSASRGMRLRLRPLNVTQPWSIVQRWVSPPLFHIHTYTKMPLSGVLRWLPVRRYLTASPNHVCNGDSTHTHTPRCWNRDWRRKRSSAPHTGAWADAAWHGQNKARCFFAATLSIKAGVSGLTCFLFEGSVETHCDDATWSVSAEVSMSGTLEKVRKGEGDLEERHSVCSYTPTVLYCFRKLLSIFHKYWLFCSREATCCTISHARLSKTLTFELNSDNCGFKFNSKSLWIRASNTKCLLI